MLRESTRRMFCTIMVCMILPLLPAGASAQVSGGPPAPTPGLHHLTFPRADGPPMGYAISIPANYSPSKPVPAHSCTAFRGSEVETRPAPEETWWKSSLVLRLPNSGRSSSRRIRCEAIGAPRKREGGETHCSTWCWPRYAIDKKKVAVTGYSMGGYRVLAFCGEIPATFQRGNSHRRHAAGIGSRVAASGFWRFILATIRSRLLAQRKCELHNFRKPV